MKRLAAIANPFDRTAGYALPHAVVAGVLAVVLTLGGVFTARALHYRIVGHATKQQVHMLQTMRFGETPGCYMPPASLFRLTNVWAVYSGYYDDEYALLGSTPCQDTDYMLPYAAQEQLTLPGPGPWVHYTFLWTQWIAGSGYEMTFAAPNGGHFAYLHVHGPWAFAPGAVLPAGSVVGSSGWPESYQYSNGSCYDYTSCESDAHLCLVSSYGAAAWFYTLVTNPPPQPKPHPKPKPKPKAKFPVAAWQAYTKRHHKRPIPYLWHGKLSYEASLWWHGHVKPAGAVISADQYFGPHKGQRYGYVTQRFSRQRLYFWPGKTWVRWQAVRSIQ